MHKRLNLAFGLCCMALVAGHAPFLNRPYVNLEFAYAEAARSFADPAYPDGLERYWNVQASPLGYSILSSVFMRLAPSPNQNQNQGQNPDSGLFWPARIASLLGAMMMLTAGWLVCRRLSVKPHVLWMWAAATMANPLVWLYTQQATSDILPAGMVCLAFALCYLAGDRWPMHLAAGLLFSLSVLVKYNAAMIGCGFVFLLLTIRAPLDDRDGQTVGKDPDNSDGLADDRNDRTDPTDPLLSPQQPQAFQIKLRPRTLALLLFYTVLPGAILAAYLLIVHHLHDVFLMPQRFKGKVRSIEILGQFPSILLMYITYLIMLLGLLPLSTSFATIKHSSRNQRFAALAVSVFVALAGYVLLINFKLGEMDYGSFSQLLPGFLFNALRIAGLPIAVFVIWFLWQSAFKQKDRLAGFVLATAGPYLLVSACFRPTQRYLLSILPLIFFWLIIRPAEPTRRWTPWLVWPSVAVFMLINFIGSMYLSAQGQAAEDMAQWIRAKGYADKTHPGAIIGHAGQHFPVNIKPPYQFTVLSGAPGIPVESSLHQTTVRVLGRDISQFSLIRWPKAQTKPLPKTKAPDKSNPKSKSGGKPDP
jgi:hypothetical protein